MPVDLDSLSLGDVVAYHRNALGISQEALARVIGVTQGCISHWETGHSDGPEMKNWAALVVVLDIDPWLLGAAFARSVAVRADALRANSEGVERGNRSLGSDR